MEDMITVAYDGFFDATKMYSYFPDNGNLFGYVPPGAQGVQINFNNTNEWLSGLGPKFLRLAAINVYSGAIIDAIQAVYEDLSGNQYTTPRCGGSGGGLSVIPIPLGYEVKTLMLSKGQSPNYGSGITRLRVEIGRATIEVPKKKGQQTVVYPGTTWYPSQTTYYGMAMANNVDLTFTSNQIVGPYGTSGACFGGFFGSYGNWVAKVGFSTYVKIADPRMPKGTRFLMDGFNNIKMMPTGKKGNPDFNIKADFYLRDSWNSTVANATLDKDDNSFSGAVVPTDPAKGLNFRQLPGLPQGQFGFYWTESGGPYVDAYFTATDSAGKDVPITVTSRDVRMDGVTATDSLGNSNSFTLLWD